MQQHEARDGRQQPGNLVGDPRLQNRELFPQKDLVIKWTTRATQYAAVTAAAHIARFTGGIALEEDLPRNEKDRRVEIIDTDANTAYEYVLNQAPFRSRGLDAEGGKEASVDKLGKAMPLAIGMFGKGDQIVDYVLDVVEGTTAAAHGRPDAISIAGISTHDGIMKIPQDPTNNGEDVHYFRKLFAPSAFKDDLSLDMSAKETLEAIMRRAKIQADAITVAIMKRDCNATLVREAQELGADVKLVSAGDLAWGLRAMNSDPEHPIVMMGRGGAEEGSIALIAAKALDATGQVRVVEEESKDLEIIKTPIWTADEFVTGARDQSMVIFSAITRNTHFGLDAVTPARGATGSYAFTVENCIIDSSGIQIRSGIVLAGN